MFVSVELFPAQACIQSTESASHDVSNTRVKGHVWVLCLMFLMYHVLYSVLYTLQEGPGVELVGLGFLGSNSGARSVCCVFPLPAAPRSHEFSFPGFIAISCLSVPGLGSAQIGLAVCQGQVRARPCGLCPGTPSYFSLCAVWLLTS